MVIKPDIPFQLGAIVEGIAIDSERVMILNRYGAIEVINQIVPSDTLRIIT